MKLFVLLCFVVVISVKCDNMVVGNVANRVVLAEHTVVKYNAVPFRSRVKQYFYSQPENKLIQGIQALDNLHSKASMNITAGGVGYSFVNIVMTSEKGTAIDYDIGIYIQDRQW